MKRYLIAAFFGLSLALSAGGADAQWPTHEPGGVAIGTQPADAAAKAAPGATTNTVTTTGPVSSETTISVGTLAGQVLTWIAAAFSVPIGGLLTAWLLRLFKLAGIKATDALRDRLQEIIVNGLNVGAQKVAAGAAGKGTVAVKNEVVASAVQYAQAHGAETIKALGLDPKSGAAVEAIKARIETAIADPAVPTPDVLDAAPAAPPPTTGAKT